MEQDRFDDFVKTIKNDSPAEDISLYLKALWYDANADWEASHNIVQDLNDNNASWIHAYLHRKEGDSFNADYWYNKAGKSRPAGTFKEEWDNLVKYFLK